MRKLILQNRFYLLLLILPVTTLFSFSNSNKTNIQPRQFTADTSAFSPNTAQGWQIHTSYLENLGDSVEFELILFRIVPPGTNWNDTSEVGAIIKADYVPAVEKVIEYSQWPRLWKIIFKPNGKCLIQLLSGPVPEGTPVMFPVITKYKK
jgi:hypothetical protein